jgi:hypothetical protein
MADPKLVDDLARRAGVSRADAEAVLEALGALAPERVPVSMRPSVHEPGPAPSRYEPTSADVEALIAEARKHPLGIDFLLDGDLSAVAMTFQVHAFTVEAARRQLTGPAR